MVLEATLKLNSFIWNLCLTFTVEPISLPVLSGVYTPYAAGNLAPLLTSVFSLEPDPRTTASCNSAGTSVTVRLSVPLYSEAGTSPVRYETWWNSRGSAVPSGISSLNLPSAEEMAPIPLPGIPTATYSTALPSWFTMFPLRMRLLQTEMKRPLQPEYSLV